MLNVECLPINNKMAENNINNIAEEKAKSLCDENLCK